MRNTVAAATLLAIGMGMSIVSVADDESPKEIKRKPAVPKVAVPNAEVKKPGLPTAAPRADDESPKEAKATIKKIPPKQP